MDEMQAMAVKRILDVLPECADRVYRLPRDCKDHLEILKIGLSDEFTHRVEEYHEYLKEQEGEEQVEKKEETDRSLEDMVEEAVEKKFEKFESDFEVKKIHLLGVKDPHIVVVNKFREADPDRVWVQMKDALEREFVQRQSTGEKPEPSEEDKIFTKDGVDWTELYLKLWRNAINYQESYCCDSCKNKHCIIPCSFCVGTDTPVTKGNFFEPK